jgi:hypothetical protein
MKPGRKPAVCGKCGKLLLGSVPIEATEIVCFFCDNPRREDEEYDSTALRSRDVR